MRQQGTPEELMELAALLEQAQTAPRDRRIEWRDPIAAHGATAIEGVRPWLADGELAAFAVRVIEQAGIAGEPQLAAKVLRAARHARPPDSGSGDGRVGAPAPQDGVAARAARSAGTPARRGAPGAGASHAGHPPPDAVTSPTHRGPNRV